MPRSSCIADADPVAAARKVAAAKFRNCGQVCISPSRFYVHESIRPEFEQAFADFAKSLVVGDGLEDGRHHGTDDPRAGARPGASR